MKQQRKQRTAPAPKFRPASAAPPSGVIHWHQLAWDWRGTQRKCVQYQGYVLGNPVATVTWVRAFPGKPAGYLATAMKRPLGVWPTLAKAQDEISFALAEVGEGLNDLFAAIAASMDRYRAEMTPIIEGVVAGLAALNKWADDGYAAVLRDRAAAAEAARLEAERREKVRIMEAEVRRIEAERRREAAILAIAASQEAIVRFNRLYSCRQRA